MRLYALIGGQNSVVGVVQGLEADAQKLAAVYPTVIDITDYQPVPQIGWSFNGTSVVGTSQSKKITRLAMRQRLTVSEMIAIMTAAETTPIVRYLMKNLEVAQFIDLSRADTQAGLGVLVQYSLLTQDRANTILNTPIAVHEAYYE